MATVLIAEDDNDIRSAYVFALSKAGHHVLQAVDGAQALEVVDVKAPDVVLLDMLMPGMSGLDFLRQSQLTSRFPGVKVLAFSNIDNPHVRDQAKELGVQEYFIKVNITPREMVKVVERYLNE